MLFIALIQKEINLRRRNETLTIYINYQHSTPLFCKNPEIVHCATGPIFADSLTSKKIILMLLVLPSSVGTILECTHNLLR